ncbi:MAG TPA: serine hydrolase domain-containing protein [Chitinophaga sp.]
MCRPTSQQPSVSLGQFVDTYNVYSDIPRWISISVMTKQFTAIAVLQQVEQGKIALQAPIRQYIPDYPVQNHPVTIENLLTRTSGIADYEVLDFHTPSAIRSDLPPKQLIDSLGQTTPGIHPRHWKN